VASLTVSIDPEILEAARLEAERRNTSLDQVVADSLSAFANPANSTEEKGSSDHEENRRRLLELMYSSPLGDLGKLPTREEIYAERTRWPRS
jgi:hypothetical protein